MKSQLVASLALSLVVALAESTSLEGQTAGEVIWTDEAHTRVSFVPGTLLRSLGSWEGNETPPLSGIGLLDEEIETLRAHVQWAKGPGRIAIEDLIAGKCPSSASDVRSQMAPDGTSSSRPLTEWLQVLGGNAYVARIADMEAGWAPASRSVATLVEFKIVSAIAGVELGAASEEVSFVDGFGWLQLGSTTLCRGSRSVLSEASTGNELFIWELSGERDRPLSRVLMILPVNADMIDTTSCNFCGGEHSVSLETIRKTTERQGAPASHNLSFAR